MSLTGVRDAWIATVGAMLAAGGALALFGSAPRDEISRSYRMESAGHFLTGVGWLLYGLVVALAHRDAVVSWALGLGLSLASLARIRQVSRQEWRTRWWVDRNGGRR